MTYEGTLTKMQTEYGKPIQYYLVFENSFLNVNQLLNKNIEISGYVYANSRNLNVTLMPQLGKKGRSMQVIGVQESRVQDSLRYKFKI